MSFSGSLRSLARTSRRLRSQIKALVKGLAMDAETYLSRARRISASSPSASPARPSRSAYQALGCGRARYTVNLSASASALRLASSAAVGGAGGVFFA